MIAHLLFHWQFLLVEIGIYGTRAGVSPLVRKLWESKLGQLLLLASSLTWAEVFLVEKKAQRKVTCSAG